MKQFEIHLSERVLELPNEALGCIARGLLSAEIDRHKRAKKAGAESARAKMGHPVTVDGVEYASKALAKKAKNKD